MFAIPSLYKGGGRVYLELLMGLDCEKFDLYLVATSRLRGVSKKGSFKCKNSCYTKAMEYVPYGDFVEFMEISCRSSLKSLKLKISRFIEDSYAASFDESVGYVVMNQVTSMQKMLINNTESQE